jgi:hypothetical protein
MKKIILGYINFTRKLFRRFRNSSTTITADILNQIIGIVYSRKNITGIVKKWQPNKKGG